VYWGAEPSAPRQTRAADTVALGSLGGSTLDGPTLGGPSTILPVPGGPEPILGMGGCSCSGSCGCGTPLSDFVDSIPGGYVTLAAGGALLAWMVMRKKGGARRPSRWRRRRN